MGRRELLESQGSFLGKKLKKLYPEYLVYLLLSGVVALCGITMLPSSGLGDVAVFGAHLLLLQTFFPGERMILSFTSTGWYLSCLMALYFLFPALYRFWSKVIAKGNRHLLRVLAAAFFVEAAAMIVLYKLNNCLAYMTPICRAMEFSIGICAGMIYLKTERPAHIPLKQMLAIIFYCCIVWLCRGLPSILAGVRELLLTAVPAALMIFYLAYNGTKITRFLHHPVFRCLNRYSFGIYLSHYVILEILAPVKWNRPELLPVMLILTLGISISVSVAVTEGRRALQQRARGF